MITPHFEVSQDADFVEIRIRVPHLRMEDGEFYVQEHEFKFHLRPYFLRLTFRQLLTEDGRETASYDAARASSSVSGAGSVSLSSSVSSHRLPFSCLL